MPRIYNKKKPPYPPTAVLIDRTTPYGNPYQIGKHGPREEVIRKFEQYILPKLDVEPLRDKDLLCHCWPSPCHGTSILRKLREEQ